MLTADDAKDIIDTYGPKRKRWPEDQRDAIDALVNGDTDLASYLKRAAKIDAMLNDWKEADDGASIDDEDADRDNDDDAEDDQDESDDDTDDEEEESDDGPGHQNVEDAGESLAEINLDPAQLADMDDMFADAIQALVGELPKSSYNVFSRDRDELTDIPCSDSQTLEGIDKAVQTAVGPLMKDLRRMIAARSQVRRIPGKRSGRLHAASLHRIQTGDDRVFSRREESPSLNTAITLLMDNSGSMGAGSGSRLQLATETAYALGTVLNKLGISFECIGFTEDYDRVDDKWMKEVNAAANTHPITRMLPLTMPKFKAFDERWTIPVMRRFAAIYDGGRPCRMGGTPEGCGLEFAAKRLLARSEERKILICMTDGQPAAASMGVPYGIHHAQSRDMVASIAAAGVDVVGIGIQHQGPKSYYPNALVISNIGEMPSMLMGVLKKLIVG